MISVMLTELGLNKNLISTMQARGSMPKADNLAKIADYLEVSVDYLLGRTDDPGQKTEPAPQNESKELELTQKELELINILRRTPPAQQEAVLNLLLSLSKGKE